MSTLKDTSHEVDRNYRPRVHIRGVAAICSGPAHERPQDSPPNRWRFYLARPSIAIYPFLLAKTLK